MRHAFRFPVTVREAIRQHVRRAVAGLDPRRFAQEPAYVAALAAMLQGTPYEGSFGKVTIISTIVTDRSPKGAEKWSGADLAITAYIDGERTQVQKAILLQAKRGAITDLKKSENDRLSAQVEKMKKLTRAPKILEVPDNGSVAQPFVISGNVFLLGRRFRRYTLEDYFVQRVTTTLDGDTRPSFVAGVDESMLTKIHVDARIRPVAV